MEKSIFQKKKRIAHFQSMHDNFMEGEDENILSGCRDYVTSIIQNMDLNFKSVHSSNTAEYIPESKVTNTNKQRNNSAKHCAPSTSEDSLQNTKNVSNLKKICISRKYPLMEKSQKILKQLKHNRRIPKQRAHLAALPDSTLKKDSSNVSSKKKHKQRVKNSKNALSDKPVFNSSSVSNKDSVKSCSKYPKNPSKKFENCETENNTKSKNSLYKKDSLSDTNNMEKANLNNTNDIKDSEYETTDSEYERFVQKNKKSLKKNNEQKRPMNKRKSSKRSTTRKTSKNIVKKFSEQSDSDCSDDKPLSYIALKSPRKKLKFISKIMAETEAITSVNDESETNMMDGDIYTRDSSENDVADNILSLNNSHETQPLKQKINGCTSTLPDLDSLCNKNCVHESLERKNSECTLTLCDKNSVCQSLEQKSSECTLTLCDKNSACESEQKNSECTLTLCDKNSVHEPLEQKNSECTLSLCDKNSVSSNSAQMEQNKSSLNILVIDLLDSDDDCHNVTSHEYPVSSVVKEENSVITTVAQNLFHSDPEESDIEVIEIIQSESRKSDHIVNKATKHESSKYITNDTTEKYQRLEKEGNSKNDVEAKSPEIVIKTEEQGNDICTTEDTHTENVNKKRDVDDSKYEAVYVTNICKEFSKDDMTKDQSEDAYSKSASLDITIQNKGIKKEDSSDDDIIVLDSVQTASHLTEMLPSNASNLSFVPNKEVKTETPDILIDYVKDVKYSSDSILKMGQNCSSCQHHSDFPVNIEKISNIKTELCVKNLANLKKDSPIGSISSKIGAILQTTALKENELKLYEVACSDAKTNTEFLSSGSCEKQQALNKPEQKNIAHLLELFKKEFQTYQEIIQTEASVEASLKMLEVHQAEKLKYIRSLVQKFVGSDQNSIETCNSSPTVKGHIDKILSDSQELNCFKASTVNEPMSPKLSLKNISKDSDNHNSENAKNTSYISNKFLQNLSHPLFHQNIPSELSKMDKDVKPHVSKLGNLQNYQFQHTPARLKLEPQSKPESSSTSKRNVNSLVHSSGYQSGKTQTMKLLNEKCNVCGKEAMAACQRCAKVFFCSHECGKKFWNDGHENICGK